MDESSPEPTAAGGDAPSAPDNEPLTDRAAADFLGLSVARLHRLRKRGEVPAVRVGWRRYRFRPADLMAYAERTIGIEPSTDSHPCPPQFTGGVSLAGMADYAKSTPLPREERIDYVPDQNPELTSVVNAILITVLDNGSTDILFEQQRRYCVVRHAINGKLQELTALPKHIQDGVLTRLKLRASLELLRPVPQTGFIPILHQGKRWNIRVSTLPGRYGETLALRPLLAEPPSRADLGITAETLPVVEELVFRGLTGGGLVLLASPPGQGRTTTAFSLLHGLNAVHHKIVTVEESREYELPGASQTYPLERRGVTRRDLQRAALLHRPDVLFLGDLRDAEDAAVAVDAALSGVLTLATVRAPDAVSAALRLGDLGVPPDRTARALRGVLAQRLAPRLCPACRVPRPPTEAERYLFTAAPDAPPLPADATLYDAPGCDACAGRGTVGRIGLFELWQINAEGAELLRAGVGRTLLDDAARAAGLSPLREEARGLALAGVIGAEAALRSS